jgi:hypothetical protein
MEGRNFTGCTSDKGLTTRIYRKLKKKEEMLTIPGHKGNAHQNHIKIPLHSC